MEGLDGPIAHANKLKFYWKETSPGHCDINGALLIHI